MKRLTKNDLHAMGIRNPHDIATAAGLKPLLYVDYFPQDYGRGGSSARWTVIGIGFSTNPMSPWYEYGRKTFYPSGRLTKQNKEVSRDEALAWASREYDIKEWERSPFGSYHPKGTLDVLRRVSKHEPAP